MWVKRLQTDTDVLQNLRMFVQELKPSHWVPSTGEGY